ncbi:MAG: competence/damage-inducible protein A [Ignavibacteria bacterium 13_1_40CM_2_61_4]|nr:MAG: competence/damage-inducible protein A [Ignavibacteria bacterium 13_1_40CM_2_61_4]
MRCIIITIGDELLIGQVVNTNASFIAEKLTAAGVEVCRMLTVPDDESGIVKAFEEALPRYDLSIATGGLGPTHDDVTKKAVCRFFGVDLVPSPEVRRSIEEFLLQRNIPWSQAAEMQTLVPSGAVIIPNRRGTAPGELLERDHRYLIVLPGVPHEMEGMMEDFVVPFVKERSSGQVILNRTLKTTGISESALAERIGAIDQLLTPGERLAFLPSASGVRMRISVTNSDRTAAERRIGEIESVIRARAGKYIYGVDEEELEQVVGAILRERGLRIAVAESCTGGLIADKITNVPGSSDYFERGVVAYSNASKIELLHVPSRLIKEHGAVSREVAEAMARGVRSVSGTDLGLSTTGIAGPTGGSDEKPVGLVWIGYSDVSLTTALKFQFGRERLIIKQRAAQAGLEMVRRRLLKIK